ncbi:MAG: S24/S26 family peptidase [Parvibaculaceae bacterium]|nr:S24/S26 family peptidase [Parvibaculaceae bacterium]
MFGWWLIRVRGRSMEPTLCDGDHVLVRRPGRWRPARPGDVVCIRREGEAQLIKRLGRRTPGGGFHLSGDGAVSAPSVDLGTVGREQIVARAILRISDRGVHFIRSRPV